jgi:hypothetical protein
MFGPEQAYLNSVRYDLRTRAARELDDYRRLEDAALNLAPVRLPPATPVRTPSRFSGNGARLPWRVRVVELLRPSRAAAVAPPARPGHGPRGPAPGDARRSGRPPAHSMELGAGPHPPSTSKY